ncbi:MAG: butyrate kinase [Clostridiales bacterium]|nr:butyrate kinase [Clostridiales bacterium]
MNYRILTVSPGSTSTKFAVIENETVLLRKTVTHSKEELNRFSKVNDQLPFRTDLILEGLRDAGCELSTMDAFSAYSGGLVSTPSGIFPVNEQMLADCTSGRLFEHPAILGAQIIHQFSMQTGKPCFLVNPPDTDEFQEVSRISGIRGIYRESHVHVLNQKEVAIRAAKSLGRSYENCNFIVCHVGGGLSIAAHRRGKMVDANDVLNGDGPMAPNRSGYVPVMPIIKMCFDGQHTEQEMRDLVARTGGLISLLGTDDTREIVQRIEAGDVWAKLVYDAFAYQLAKYIGSYACTLQGNVDAVVMTGGVSNDSYFISKVKESAGWIAPFIVYGGDFEMEALASGAIRGLTGEEMPKTYTGVPVWEKFDFEPGI